MKEIKPNQPHPPEELLEKVIYIAFIKGMVSLQYRGEFNKFGVYVQSKDIYDTYDKMKDKYQPTTSKTVYMAGGKFIPKLIFTEVRKDPPLEYPYEIYDGLDIMAPDYSERAEQRENDYRNRLKIGETETLINKYKPGSWEHKLDLLWKFTEEFEMKYAGQGLP